MEMYSAALLLFGFSTHPLSSLFPLFSSIHTFAFRWQLNAFPHPFILARENTFHSLSLPANPPLCSCDRSINQFLPQSLLVMLILLLPIILSPVNSGPPLTWAFVTWICLPEDTPRHNPQHGFNGASKTHDWLFGFSMR